MDANKTQVSGFRSQVSGGLGRSQLIHITGLARQAYLVWGGRAAAEAASGSTRAFADWRRDQQEIAVGVRSLSHCAAEDYATLRDHFHRTRLSYLKIDTRREVSLAPAMEAIR